MPKKSTDAEAALQKLGQRLRAGMAVQHPAQNLDAVRGAVREQYERKTARPKAPQPPQPSKQREPEEPER